MGCTVLDHVDGEKHRAALDRIAVLEAALAAIVQAAERVERIYDDGGLQQAIDEAEKLIN